MCKQFGKLEEYCQSDVGLKSSSNNERKSALNIVRGIMCGLETGGKAKMRLSGSGGWTGSGLTAFKGH